MAKALSNRDAALLQYVQQCVRRNRDARRPVERRWYENVAFIAGYTNVEFISNKLIQTEGGIMSNPQVQDKLRKYHAKLCAPRMMPECIPRHSTARSERKARMANAIIEHFFDTADFVYADQDSKLCMMAFGNGILDTGWDPRSGQIEDRIEYKPDGTPDYATLDMPEMDPSGQPDITRFKKEKSLQRTKLATGLPVQNSINVLDFFPDPQWKHLTLRGCLNYAVRHTIPRDMLPWLWPGANPDDVSHFQLESDAFIVRNLDEVFGKRSNTAMFERRDTCEVFEFCHAPIVAHIGKEKFKLDYPSGFRMVFTGNQILLRPTDLPYNSYPHVTFRDRMFPGRGWGLAVVDLLRKNQIKLDMLEQLEWESISRSASPWIIEPYGLNDTAFQGKPGEKVKIDFEEHAPRYGDVPNLPPYLFQMRNEAMADMESLSMVSSPVGGSVPSRGDSAAYLDRLLSENQVAMAATVREIELAQGHSAGHLIKLCEDHLPIGYLFRMVGPDGRMDVVEYKGEPFDLLEVRVVPGSASMHYPDQIRTAMTNLVSNGVIRTDAPMGPEQLKVVEIMMGKPIASALRELQGGGPRRSADQNIQRMLSGQEAHFAPWMKAEVHIRTILDFMDSPEFWELVQPIQAKFEAHLQMLQSLIAPGAILEGQPGEVSQAPQGAAGVPASANGYTGPAGKPNPFKVLQGGN